MFRAGTRRSSRGRLLAAPLALTMFALLSFSSTAFAQRKDNDDFRNPRAGDLVVSRSVFTENAAGVYPLVFNMDLTDASFGITSKILLDYITLGGNVVGTLEVPNSTQPGVTQFRDQLVTSFSSKSELALNLSTDGTALTFMGYVAKVGAIDISNTNTPAVVDPTNPVTATAYRAVAELDSWGNFKFTETNAYSGNNGRAAIMFNRVPGIDFFLTDLYFTAGNAGNGANPQPSGIILGAGAQFIRPVPLPEIFQKPGLPTPAGSFNVTQLGAVADKIGKDDNFRGLTIFNNVIYVTKGSGGNGVNTVYFIDTSGNACPNGVGVPVPGAKLPTHPLAYDASTLATTGLPSNMCILRGFPATLNSALKKKTTTYPFGIWFADANTVYVADEGDGTIADATLTPAGLQKWVFNSSTESWTHVYTLQTGLGLGATYSFPGDDQYPTGNNAATGLPWAPVTDGIRNITGKVNGDGTVTVWGVTSTASGNGDQGADPNKLVAITDVLANEDAGVAALESFVTMRTAGFGEVLRGVAFAPKPRF